MELSSKIASDITIFSKYAKYNKETEKREDWEAICDRKQDCLVKQYPELELKIVNAMKFERKLKVLGSMRMAQFAGVPIERNHSRVYNCAFHSAKDIEFFSNTMFLLLGGSGVGYSVQDRHISQLPELQVPLMRNGKVSVRKFLVSDTIEGWSDAIKVLMNYYLKGAYKPKFDFSDIREKGMPLITAGGKAPGPEPLRTALSKMAGILDNKEIGTRLTSPEVSDLCCYIADAVYSGGIRRAAMICLFDMTDEAMLGYKAGSYWDKNAHRARVNVSAVALRENQLDHSVVWADGEIESLPKTTKEQYQDFWKFVQDSGTGEPGIYWTNDLDSGTNPSLRSGTKVVTGNGIYPIESLEKKSFKVPNLNGEWSEAKCWKSGKDKPLWKLTFETGAVYYSTGEHEWPILVNDRYVKCRTDSLVVRDEMPTNNFERPELFKGSIGTYKQGFLVGWLYGDGCLTKRTDTGKYVASFIVSDKDGENVLNTLLEEIKLIDGVDRKVYKRGKVSEFQVGSPKFIDWAMNTLGADKKELGLPKKLWSEWTDDCIRGFVNGLFSSDGHFPTDSHGVSLISSRELLAKDVQDLLGFYGIKSSLSHSENKGSFPNGKDYGKKYHRYCVRTNVNGRMKFQSIFEIAVHYKQEALNKNLRPFLINESNRLVSIELTDLKEDVWDISVQDKTHCFQLPQVTTGNCCEIALKDKQFCNLTTINFSTVTSQADLIARAKTASFLGTLQAGFTDFHYLGDEWASNCEEEALLGVSVTGIADGNNYRKYDWKAVAEAVVKRNVETAKLIGINSAARTTCIKPEGTTSLVCGTSSGIHGRHAHYYIRRMRLEKSEAIAQYLMINHPELVAQDKAKPTGIVLELPQKSPDRSIYRTESVMDCLERVKYFSEEWVKNGHVSGGNTHNVSCTISVKPDEWKQVGIWMWNNREYYNGIAVLPYDGGHYIQPPFEDCTKEKYESMMKTLKKVDLSKIVETEDNTEIGDTIACQGGSCEI